MASQQSDIQYDQGGGVTTAIATLRDGTTHSATLTSSAATDFVDVSKVNRVSLHVVNGATNSVVFTVEGSIDGTNFSTIAYGEGSSAAYTQAAKTVVASAKTILFLPDADAIRFLRLNVSSGNSVGTAVTVFGKSG